MLRHVILFSAFCVFLTTSFRPGPAYPPTRGEVWPKPHQLVKEDTYFKLTPLTFTITEKGQTCAILKTAIERYTNVLRSTYLIAQGHARKLSKHLNVTDAADTATESNNRGTLQALLINLSAPCETYPHLDMDEKYTLNISSISTLNSDSVWGVLRGLETFVQLFYMSNGYKDVLVNTTQIVDFPKYTHRGLLIDTSRHYLSMATILKTLDAMEMNKMNVLHWHIVDDESFPYQSEILPTLSNGAYDPTMVYTAANINQIINYARDRGIRILPEFDAPDHANSWGVAYPNILTTAQPWYSKRMDPTKNLTYTLISDLYKEVQERFPDEYFHVGGKLYLESYYAPNYVNLLGWRVDPQIKQFMAEHNMTKPRELYSLFMSRVISLLGDRSKPIVWEEVFDEGVPLPNGTIVQLRNKEKMVDVLTAGHKVISEWWHLNRYIPGGNWIWFYSNDPREELAGETKNGVVLNLNNVLGGEALVWGKEVDDTNVISRVWPRASAVAEVLWTGVAKSFDYLEDPYGPEFWPHREIQHRIEEHYCRMRRRGIHAQPPNGPGFCITGN